MNIGLVFIGNNQFLENAFKIYTENFRKRGHNVTPIIGMKDSGRLTGFQYLVFFVDSGSIFNKQNRDFFKKFISETGMITAKFASIYTNARPFVGKTFSIYMKQLEQLGLIIHDCRILSKDYDINQIADSIEPLKQND